MYFKKLELIGFKSFAEKTVLNFEPGVTAVVGPNGCGKSNIFDAIRWVLGEQSVKAMRGSSMEDVIFNGTASKPPLGFAEVSLIFSNENKFFHLDFAEIMITRRLFRSGESEYLINKNNVRLKDINELLMGTGIASESYSLVEQGKIDLVLSSRPEDRRAIFDEAAGITKYKSRKKEALNKLKDTEDNLLRLSDIIEEVKRQINSVERQAAKARRYQENFQNLKDLELKLALHELRELNEQIEKLKSQKENSKTNLHNLENEILQFNQQKEDLSFKLQEITFNIENCDKEALKADNIVDRFSDQINVNKERINEFRKRIEDLNREKQLIITRLDEEKARLATVRQELASFDTTVSESTRDIKIRKESLETISQESALAHRTILDSKKGILEFTSQLTRVRNDCLKLNSELTVLSTRIRRLSLEKAKVSEEKLQVDKNFEQFNSQLSLTKNQVDSLSTGLNSIQQTTKTQQLSLDEVENSINKLEKEISNLASQKEFLLNLKTKYADLPDAGDATVIIDSRDLLPGMNILGKVERINDNGHISCKVKIIDLDLDKVIKREGFAIAQLADLIASKEKISSEIAANQRIILSKESELKDAQMKFSNINTQAGIVKENSLKFDEELSIINEELVEVSKESGAIEASLEKSKTQSSALEKEIINLETLISHNQELVVNLSLKRETTLVDITQLETQFSSLADKRQSLENSLRLMESSFNQDTHRQQDNDRQSQEADDRISQLGEHILQLDKEINQAKVSKDGVLRQLEEYKVQRDELNNSVKSKQLEMNNKTAQVDDIRQADFDLSSKEQEANFKILGIKNRLDSIYHINLDSLEPPKQLLTEEELGNIQAEIQKLKEKLDSYGTVNLVAIEEHEELKTRYEFLINQQNDLLSAKDSIHKAIAKINQTTRKMFLETFAKIQENFKSYYRLLFNGGEAQIFLIDENDVLESGIEIVCRPPGKKLQNISLLSGGEKSLSAIALIFAVFKVRPSPFCILDEIDAALDESNIDRYNRVLHEFLKTTQFIIITHNKKTITNADVMYGITMQESGVSKVVSVKFAKDKAAKEISPKEPTAV
jgi:chromosome segregation protein